MDREALKEHILKTFENKKERLIAFWYDVNGENESIIDDLQFDNIKIHKLTKRNNLLTKKLLEHDDTTSNYLIYANFEKPEPKDNWFLDTQFYSREFSVDEVANLCNEFQIYDPDVKAIFKAHLKFFNNRERVKKFAKILPSNKSTTNIYVAMLATLVGGKLPEIFKITQRYLIKTLIEKVDVDKEFASYGLCDKFWDFMDANFGYKGERNPKLLLASIIFRKLKQQLSGATFPENYKKYTCANTAEVECNLFLENWFRDSELMPYYKELTCNKGILDESFHISENITDWSDIIKDEPDFQTLEAFDTYLVNYLVNSFETLKCEDKKILEKRKNTLFYDKYKFIYESLYWAIELNNLVKNQNIPDMKPQEFIKKYAGQYYRIDKAYRKFYYYCMKANNRGLDKVKDAVEKAYVNKYLDELNSKFSKQMCELAPIWSVDGIPMQKDFYHNEIKKQKSKTVVIISDALRYEIAEEIMQEIKSSYTIKADTELDYMLGSIPSYTKLGMAALLPHDNLTMNSKFEVLADGLSTVGSENRAKILKATNENSRVLSLSDFEDLSREELREIFAGLDVAYVYQDKIDSTGEHNEKDLFVAAEQALREIVFKIKFIFNNSLASNIIVTADHGFLYQYSDLQEHQKISIGTVDAIETKKRFILSKNAMNTQGVMNFDMSYILKDSDLIASIPHNINRFKTAGAGINYVHGGASLQEIVIPVLKIKQNRKQEIIDADIVLENTSRKITNNKFTLSFMQKDSISDTVKPCSYSVSMWDEENNLQISNEIIIDANIDSDNMEDRIFKKTLELRSFQADKNKDYYLIIKKVGEVGEPYAKIAFTINLMFSIDEF